MEKYQFKPFERVLVRNDNDFVWRADIYSHYCKGLNYHVCAGSNWIQCIPYNENTAHLLGTTEPYEEPKPKVWYVTDLKAKSTCIMTQKQFDHFVENVLCSNANSAYQIGRIKK